MEDEGGSDMSTAKEGEGTGSEGSRDSFKTAGSSGRAGNQSALVKVDEKLKKLHNGEAEHVSSDEESVLEEVDSGKNSVNTENNDIEKESLDSEEEDFKLHVDVDVSSDEEGSSGGRSRQTGEEREVIELSAGEDDDCEVLEIKGTEDGDGRQADIQQEESVAGREKSGAVEVVDIDDGADLDGVQAQVHSNSGVDAGAAPKVEGGHIVEGDAAGGDELGGNEESGGEEVERKTVDRGEPDLHEAFKDSEDSLDKRDGEGGHAGVTVYEGDESETEEQLVASDEKDCVVVGGSVGQDSAEVDDPRTMVPCTSDLSREGAITPEPSDSDYFVGFVVSRPHSFHKEFLRYGAEDEVTGILHISVQPDAHVFTPDGVETPAAASGSEAGDSGRLSPVPTESSRGNSPASGDARGRKKRRTLDVNSPVYMKPFELGWKRELVYRSSFDSSNRRMADVYYYTPGNRKVRSAREVLEHVDGVDLTIKNFLFSKEPMGLDSSRETIRDARKSLGLRDLPTTTAGAAGRDERDATPPPPPKSPEKQKSPKVAETVPVQTEPKSPPPPPASVSPPVALRKAATTPTSTRTFPRIKVTPTRVQKVGVVKRIQPRPLLPKPREEPPQQPRPLLQKQREDHAQDQDVWSSKAVPKKAAAPTTWSSTPKSKERGRKRASSGEEGPPAPSKQPCAVHHKQSFVHDVCAMYNVLRQVFHYLKVQELLRAARVCHLWRDLAEHPSLWATVHMKNSKVSDWEGLANTLSARNTSHLDLRKMLLPQRTDEVAAMWQQFCDVVGRLRGLERLDLCRCPASVVQHVLTACPGLLALNATAISCGSISLQDAGALGRLEELRLKSLSGITLDTPLDVLSRLSNLKHLALTTFRNLGQQGVDVIGSLENLELLELGEVNNLPATFPAQSLACLSKLRRLRLEKVQGPDALTFNYLDTARALPELGQLELVNFDVKPGFDAVLARCTNIRKLLIIPTYVTQSATTNRMVLSGVLQLAGTLQQFVWGVTHELLRVTELFVDQCDVDQVKKELLKKGDCIPVLKPVPGIEAVNSPSDVWSCEEKYGGPTPSVEILSLPRLHRLLNLQLPTTKVRLLKIPFHATWRQYLADMHA